VHWVAVVTIADKFVDQERSPEAEDMVKKPSRIDA